MKLRIQKSLSGAYLILCNLQNPNPMALPPLTLPWFPPALSQKIQFLFLACVSISVVYLKVFSNFSTVS